MTQPWATVIAGALAVLAASIAFFGVFFTVRATDRRERDVRKEGEKHRRREEARAVVVDAMTAVVNLYEHIDRLDSRYNMIDVPPTDSTVKFGTKLAETLVPATKLRIFGFDDAADQVTDFSEKSGSLYMNMSESPEGGADTDWRKIRDSFDATIAALRQTIESIDHPLPASDDASRPNRPTGDAGPSAIE